VTERHTVAAHTHANTVETTVTVTVEKRDRKKMLGNRQKPEDDAEKQEET